MSSTAAPARSKSRRQRFRETAQQVMGMDREEFLHLESVTRGTGQQRQRPHRASANVHQMSVAATREERDVIDRLRDALARTVDRETAFPFDGAAAPLFAEGDVLTITLGESHHVVRLGAPYRAFERIAGADLARDRWRYKLYFTMKTDPVIMVTQQQLVRLHIKPICLDTLAPTHWLPSGEYEHRLHGAVFTSAERFARAKARLAANWQRNLRRNAPLPTPLLGTVVGYRKEAETVDLRLLEARDSAA